MPGSGRHSARTIAATVALIALGVTLTGCASDPLADQYRAGSGKNYIAGDGSVTEISPENRGAPIDFAGTTLTGESLSASDLRGHPAVVNFWYAGCAPCRKEAPELEKVFQAQQAEGVSFVGVNVRDQAETAQAFNRTFGVTYPSVTDQGGAVQLAFASNVPPKAVPTTIVLDSQGRVAARVLGGLQDPSILTSLIQRVVAEDAP